MSNATERTVVVLGASNNPDRYSYRAVRELLSHGFKTIPVNPHLNEILGLPVISSLKDINEGVDTLTVYVSPKHSSVLKEEILALKPRRVIFNPGAENEELEKALDISGIPYLHACSLVLLSTGRF
ncbi:CoA-binding protein [Gracilinema caldarium]|uniref:CoA-binding protein n=1 Tax=Gracilinema caldarium TaxID=215591 RepID=UPI0026EEDEA0|nr:CoA-binding protein [Gracilinema caldarium]